ncbi:MAG: hypothetical protein WC741_02280 [Patescibacteria group bacterium]|jgi:hypothetical protein
MTIKEARKILGKTAKRMTDEQVEKAIDTTTTLVNILLDQWEKMTPDERSKWETKKK